MNEMNEIVIDHKLQNEMGIQKRWSEEKYSPIIFKFAYLVMSFDVIVRLCIWK